MDEIKKISEIWRSQLEECDEAIHDSEKFFFQIFLDIAKKSNRILEIGSGRGRMVQILRNHGIKSDFFCIDIGRFKERIPAFFVIGDARKLPFKPGSFDLVYSLGVVEHFKETEKSIIEQIDVTGGNGHILITTPRLSIFTPLRWIVWFLKYRNKGSFKELMGSNLTLRYIKSQFAQDDCKVLYYGSSGFFLPGSLKKLKGLVKRILPERIFGAYLWCIIQKI